MDHSGESGDILMAGANQPPRRDFGITFTSAASGRLLVRSRDIWANPFCTLVMFERADGAAKEDFLIVSPLSGHFAVLARDMILGLVPYFRVFVTDWTNVRHVPADQGAFGLDGNIATAIDAMRTLRPGATVLGLCQGGVPALAAAVVLAMRKDPATPSRLVLMGAPIDAGANPTRVVRLLRSEPLSWFEANLISTVPPEYPGRGRRVYAAENRLVMLLTHLFRHLSQGGELGAKMLFDDGSDPEHHPFFDLYSSIMDLDAQYFLENAKAVFQDCAFANGSFTYRGEPVEPSCFRNRLLTIEGSLDDVAAPGQGSAAHRLCTEVSKEDRAAIIVPGAGHFSLFYGEIWRKHVLPVICDFCQCIPLEGGPSRQSAFN